MENVKIINNNFTNYYNSFSGRSLAIITWEVNKNIALKMNAIVIL